MTDAATTSSQPRPASTGNWRQRVGYGLYHGAGRFDWAEPEVRGLDQVVKPGDTVLDVGAALGMYTVPLSYLTGPTGRVFSVDPQPRNFHVVRFLRRLVGTKGGTIRRIAFGPQEGESSIAVPIILGLPIFGHGHISDGVQEKGPHRIRYTPTPVDTIDAWVARDGVEKVSFIKVDVEGFEPSVVEGASALIERDRPSLLLEIEDRRLVRYGRTTADDFHRHLMTRWPDYTMYTWVDGAWTPTDAIRPEVRNYLFTTRLS
ncbi:FkbM family methyltransferase [Pseudolysinimonas sp.]